MASHQEQDGSTQEAPSGKRTAREATAAAPVAGEVQAEVTKQDRCHPVIQKPWFWSPFSGNIFKPLKSGRCHTRP